MNQASWAALLAMAGLLLPNAAGAWSSPAHETHNDSTARELRPSPDLNRPFPASHPPPHTRSALLAILQSDIDRTGGREEFMFRARHGRDLPFAVSLGAGAAALLPGKAGRKIDGTPERPEPSADAIHAAGFAAWLCFSRSLRNGLSVAAMLCFEHHAGRTVDEGSLGNVSYGDMFVYPVLFGARLHLPLSTPTGTWLRQDFSPAPGGLSPFTALYAGAAYRSGVAASGAPYWNAATVFSARADLGVSIGLGSMSVEAALSIMYHSEPPEAVWYAECDATIEASFWGAVRVVF